MSDFGREVTVAVMAAGIDHRGIGLTSLYHADIFAGVKFCHERRMILGNVVVN
jgi:hypothetical protein